MEASLRYLFNVFIVTAFGVTVFPAASLCKQSKHLCSQDPFQVIHARFCRSASRPPLLSSLHSLSFFTFNHYLTGYSVRGEETDPFA